MAKYCFNLFIKHKVRDTFSQYLCVWVQIKMFKINPRKVTI